MYRLIPLSLLLQQSGRPLCELNIILSNNHSDTQVTYVLNAKTGLVMNRDTGASQVFSSRLAVAILSTAKAINNATIVTTPIGVRTKT